MVGDGRRPRCRRHDPVVHRPHSARRIRSVTTFRLSSPPCISHPSPIQPRSGRRAIVLPQPATADRGQLPNTPSPRRIPTSELGFRRPKQAVCRPTRMEDAASGSVPLTAASGSHRPCRTAVTARHPRVSCGRYTQRNQPYGRNGGHS